MKNLTYYAIFLLLATVFACKDKTAVAEETATEFLSSPPDTCYLQSAEGVPKINRYLDFTAQERVILRSDEQYNWQLEVYHLYTCELKAVYAIPQNEPANAPYYLANLNYNNARRQLAIRGSRSFYLLDLAAGQLSEAITPSFPDALLSDASSGMIQHLEVWEDYLVGAVSDGACFVYQLTPAAVKILHAAATYAAAKDERPKALFLIPNDTGYYQAILPVLDANTGTFEVRPVFQHPLPLDTTVHTQAVGSPYLRLKQQDGKTIGIDMRNGTLLPSIAQKATN